jgi:hypothetical protein
MKIETGMDVLTRAARQFFYPNTQLLKLKSHD